VLKPATTAKNNPVTRVTEQETMLQQVWHVL